MARQTALKTYYKDFRRFLRDTVKENKRNGNATDTSAVFDTFTQMYVYETSMHELEWVNEWYERYNTQRHSMIDLYHELIVYFGKGKIEELKIDYDNCFEEIEEMDQDDLEWYGFETVQDQWIDENYDMLLTLLARDWLIEKLEKIEKRIYKDLERRYNTTLEEVIPVNRHGVELYDI